MPVTVSFAGPFSGRPAAGICSPPAKDPGSSADPAAAVRAVSNSRRCLFTKGPPLWPPDCTVLSTQALPPHPQRVVISTEAAHALVSSAVENRGPRQLCWWGERNPLLYPDITTAMEPSSPSPTSQPHPILKKACF